jgi:hypothetical protein
VSTHSTMVDVMDDNADTAGSVGARAPVMARKAGRAGRTAAADVLQGTSVWWLSVWGRGASGSVQLGSEVPCCNVAIFIKLTAGSHRSVWTGVASSASPAWPPGIGPLVETYRTRSGRGNYGYVD